MLQTTGQRAERNHRETSSQKMGIVEEECDETIFWLEIIEELQMVTQNEEIAIIKKEANEILSITVTSIKTVKNNLSK